MFVHFLIYNIDMTGAIDHRFQVEDNPWAQKQILPFEATDPTTCKTKLDNQRIIICFWTNMSE